jgi:paraquat-inducible protein B
MNAHPEPNVSRRRGFPLVWLVPLAAFLAAGWMVFSEYRNHGPLITIEFMDGSGVEAGKTPLDYKGVSVGRVRSVDLKPDLSGVVVQVRLERSAASLASDGAQFWVVQPEISFGSVRGLDTILTGARLNVIPGKGSPATHFVGLDRAPLPGGGDGSRNFVLESDRLGSLNPGSPVFYREIKVGVVEDSRLAVDSTSVRIRIRIEAPYVDLVRTNTRFWNAGGFDFQLSLFGGGNLKNTSLESLINGGLAFATPDDEPLAPPAPAGMEFGITTEPEKSWLKWRPRILIQSPETPPKDPKSAGLHPLLTPAEKTAP